jgi:hypothetical protein
MHTRLVSAGEQRVPSMATTAIEINVEAGVVEGYQRRVQELTDGVHPWTETQT